MKHCWVVIFGFVFVGCGLADEAMAQQPLILQRPTISPYLNLLRNDAPIGWQYYQRVLQERSFRSAYQQQFQMLNQLNQRVRQLEAPAPISTNSRLGQTGHPTRFQSYGGFYGGSSNRSGFGRSR